MGMLSNEWKYNLEKPCPSCFITAMQGDLQFEDGRSAMTEDGVWLHHAVLYNGLGYTWGSKTDLVCSNTVLSLWLGWPHRIFATGNERTPVRLNDKWKFGIQIDDGDAFSLLYDLVNVGKEKTKVYLVMVSVLYKVVLLYWPLTVNRHMKRCRATHQATNKPAWFGWT
jgi:hypothetical protein